MRPSRIAPVALAAAIALAAAGGGAAANLHLLAPRQRASAPLVLDQAAPSGTDTTVVPGDEPGEGSTGQPPGTTTTTTTDTPGNAPPTTEAPAFTVPPITSPPANSTPPTTVPPPSSSRSYAVGDAASVVLSVSGGRVSVATIRPGAGWTYAIVRQTSEEVEIAFRSGEREAALNAHLEGGQLVVEIEGPSGSPDD